MVDQSKLKHEFAVLLASVLRTMAEEKLGNVEELHGAEVELVSNLLVQVRVRNPGGPDRIIEIKVSEPVVS